MRELDQGLATHQEIGVHTELDRERGQSIRYHMLILQGFKSMHLVIRVQARTPLYPAIIILFIAGYPGYSPLSYYTHQVDLLCSFHLSKLFSAAQVSFQFM